MRRQNVAAYPTSPYRSTREREREAQFRRSPNISAVRQKLGECRAKTGLQCVTDCDTGHWHNRSHVLAGYMCSQCLSLHLTVMPFPLSVTEFPISAVSPCDDSRFRCYLKRLNVKTLRCLFLPVFLFERGKRLVQEHRRLGLRRDAHGTILPPQPGSLQLFSIRKRQNEVNVS